MKDENEVERGGGEKYTLDKMTDSKNDAKWM